MEWAGEELLLPQGPEEKKKLLITGNERIRYGGPLYKSSDFIRYSQLEQTQREGARKVNS